MSRYFGIMYRIRRRIPADTRLQGDAKFYPTLFHPTELQVRTFTPDFAFDLKCYLMGVKIRSWIMKCEILPSFRTFTTRTFTPLPFTLLNCRFELLPPILPLICSVT